MSRSGAGYLDAERALAEPNDVRYSRHVSCRQSRRRRCRLQVKAASREVVDGSAGAAGTRTAVLSIKKSKDIQWR